MRQKKKNTLLVLIKKQITQSLSFTKSKKSFDYLGFFLYLALISALAYIFITIFSRIIKIYCNIEIYEVRDFKLRQFELLSIAYMIVFILLTFSSIMAINKTIFENEDIKIMTAMPISSSQLFWSKMIIVYAKQVFVSLLTIMPINLAFSLVEPQMFYYYAMSLVLCFIFPLLSISIAAVLALPVHFIKSFLSNKYVLIMVIISVITTAACAGYAYLVNATKDLIIKGDVSDFFNGRRMDFFENLAKMCVPANFFAGLVLKRNVLFNLGIIASICAVCAGISIGIIHFILNRAIQNRLTVSARSVRMFRSVKQKSTLSALIGKEFNTIFRTPAYTFLYFSMALAMPVMTGLCMSMGISFIRTSINVPINFELALILVLIFGVLTNTFCATNISRDGISFYTAKAMPVSIRQIIAAKILLCTLVAAFSIFLSVFILCIMSYITIPQGLYIFAVCLLMSFAQICFATRLDFNRPKFSPLEDGQIKESNTTMSVIIITGLVFTAAVGFLVLFIAIFAMIKPSIGAYRTASKLFVAVMSAALAFLSYKFLTSKLSQKYYNFMGGSV